MNRHMKKKFKAKSKYSTKIVEELKGNVSVFGCFGL